MQSRTSFFNGTLLRKNLTRFWPLWGMASFVGALFPLALVMELLRNRHFELTQIDLAGAYYSVASDVVPVLSLIYAVLCAMAVWNYLYGARSVSMMHAMPIRREGLLATGFLSGMAMMLIPYGVTGGLCVLVSLVTGAFSLKALLVTVLVVLGESFFYFATATFAAFLTGNLFAMPAIYLVLHFLEVILDSLFSFHENHFLYHTTSGPRPQESRALIRPASDDLQDTQGRWPHRRAGRDRPPVRRIAPPGAVLLPDADCRFPFRLCQKRRRGCGC